VILPPVIGHRGAAALAPENTLASFARAAACGAAMVEFDVRLSADRQPVVFHDDSLDRTTAGHGPVRRHGLAELQALGVASLDEVLRLCGGLGLRLNMEIKPDRGDEALTARIAVGRALALWQGPPPLVSSFSRRALAEARVVAPDWPRGLLVGRVPRDWARAAERLGCVALHADHRRLDAALVAEIRGAGLAVLAYTVNDPARAETLWRWGVASVFSDDPGAVMNKSRQKMP
jgi:glycerophosphoryl diester phosphodiesterase